MSQPRKNRLLVGSFCYKAIPYIYAIAGTFLMALGVKMIYEPLNMVTGGFSGIAILVYRLTDNIPVWVTTSVLNIPLITWAFWEHGFAYVRRTIFAVLFFSLFLSVIPSLNLVGNDYLVAALIGGTLNGTGLSLVFSRGMSTGGTDLLSSLIHAHLPALSLSRLLLFIDGAIVIAGMWAFGLQTGLYALIAVCVTSKVMDGVLEGLKYAKMVFVISGEADGIAQDIMQELERGVSQIKVTGMYTGKNLKMLLCIVSRKEILKLGKIVENRDQNAFVIVSDVREVMGEGFVKHS